jgi:SAM-dependent methyltransferase/3-polyprenyl-4-hydroxybenzoate decarboxylase
MTIHRMARAGVLRAYDHADTVTLLGDDGAVRRFSGDSAELVRAILGFVAVPRTRPELAAHLSDLAGAPVEVAGTVEETLAHLEAAGAIREAPQASPPKPPGPRPARVVVGVTGAIAATFTPNLVMLLIASGCAVRVAATPTALRFVSATALEALTHAPVASSLWSSDAGTPVPHIDLARWADAMVVSPATATTIARLAAGSCDTVVSAAAIATRSPVLVVPSMNDAMYLAPAVQRNLAQLRDDGFYLAHPACGIEVADAPFERVPTIGPAPPVDVVAQLVHAILQHHAAARPAPPPPPSWDALYRGPPEDLPWHTDEIDADVAALLGSPTPGAAHLLDVGAGLGTAAISASDLGWSVVATDVSEHALRLARERAGARPIAWIADDILHTRLRGAFDVILDRGLCHLLGADDLPRYAAAVAELLRPGGRLLLKCHSSAEPHDHGARRFSREDLAALFGAAFALERADDTVFPGPRGHAPKALLAVLRRR